MKVPPTPKGRTVRFLPTNLVVTVVEANDLGDVIGRGAQEFDANKADLAARLLELVGGGAE